MTYTSKESSEQVELEFLSKSIGFCMKNERFGPDSDLHSDRRLSLPAQNQKKNRTLSFAYNLIMRALRIYLNKKRSK